VDSEQKSEEERAALRTLERKVAGTEEMLSSVKSIVQHLLREGVTPVQGIAPGDPHYSIATRARRSSLKSSVKKRAAENVQNNEVPCVDFD
jgi:hypothetical protein